MAAHQRATSSGLLPPASGASATCTGCPDARLPADCWLQHTQEAAMRQPAPPRQSPHCHLQHDSPDTYPRARLARLEPAQGCAQCC